MGAGDSAAGYGMSEDTTDAEGPPNLLLSLTEAGRAAIEAGKLLLDPPELERPAAGASGVVLVIPGFTTDDKATIILRRKLSSAGYDVHGWQQGLNLGIRRKLFDGLVAEFDRLHEDCGVPISVVGQSLGGIYARQLAKLRPDEVCHVITLGTPINDPDGSGSRATALYKLLNPSHGDDTPAPPGFDHWDVALPPPVPTTAIYSRRDGICNWHTCLQQGNHPHVENLEIPGSHLGMGVNGDVLEAISERLATARCAA